MRLSITKAITLFGAVTAAGFAAVVLTGAYALHELKVNGPLYGQIKLGNDLVADILPPPAYVIESFLEATLALREPSTLAGRRDRLRQLRKDYDDRREFWVGSSLDTQLKTQLTQKSDSEVQRFWKAIDSDLLPALEKQDMAGAQKAYDQVNAAYTAHRSVIDSIVEGANRQNMALEKKAAGMDGAFAFLNWGVSLAVLVVLAIGIGGIALGVVRPIVRMTGAMKNLADGQLGVDVPFVHRRDEVGAMAAALQVFKEGALDNARLREEQARTEAENAVARRQAVMVMAETVERETGTSVAAVAGATREVDGAAASLSSLADSLSSESQAVAAASEQALANAQTVAAAAEQMTASIHEIATQVTKATAVTKAAVDGSDRAQGKIQSLSVVWRRSPKSPI